MHRMNHCCHFNEGDGEVWGGTPSQANTTKRDHFDGRHAFVISFNRLFYWGAASKWSALRNSLKWLINCLDPPTLTVIAVIGPDRQKAFNFEHFLPSCTPFAPLRTQSFQLSEAGCQTDLVSVLTDLNAFSISLCFREK